MENLTVETFQEKICDCGLDGSSKPVWKYKGKLPAVVDFYADWCAPCKMIEPILDDLAEEYDGKIDFFRVDTGAHPQLAALFKISSIPSLLFIPLDEKPQMAVGALPKASFISAFKDILKVK